MEDRHSEFSDTLLSLSACCAYILCICWDADEHLHFVPSVSDIGLPKGNEGTAPEVSR